MSDLYLIGGAILAVLIYLVASGKLNIKALQTTLQGQLKTVEDGVHARLNAIESKASAPVDHAAVVTAALQGAASVVAAAAPPPVAAVTPKPTPAPAALPPGKVFFDPTGKTIELFQQFRQFVGMTTPIYSTITGNLLDVGMRDMGDGTEAPKGPINMWAGQNFIVDLGPRESKASPPFSATACAVEVIGGSGVEYGTAKITITDSAGAVVYDSSNPHGTWNAAAGDGYTFALTCTNDTGCHATGMLNHP